MNETIGLDLNPYCSRAVLLDAKGRVLSHVDTKDQFSVARWIRSSLDRHPAARVVGSALDDFSEEVDSELRCADKRVELLSPTLSRALYHAGRPWNLKRKLHRARLLAYLHEMDVQPYGLEQWLRQFEHERAREILES